MLSPKNIDAIFLDLSRENAREIFGKPEKFLESASRHSPGTDSIRAGGKGLNTMRPTSWKVFAVFSWYLSKENARNISKSTGQLLDTASRQCPGTG